MKIWCCGCQSNVSARRTSGTEIYPHRPDLHGVPFWICDGCGNYVGTHYKTKDYDKPLGSIPTKELREARKRIHAVIDPIWKSGKMRRGSLYKSLSDSLGYQYHSAEINSLEDAGRIYQKAVAIAELEGRDNG